MSSGERQRDPERTKSEILRVATEEFATHGFAGTRVEEIAARTRTTKRMIYYYFETKEGLYERVLEEAFRDILRSEAEVDVENLDPVVAIRRLAEFAFDRHESHPTFSRLISYENMQEARFMRAADGFDGRVRPIVGMLARVLERGQEAGVFRGDIDAVDLHMLISSYCFFRMNNRFTFAANFERDLADPRRREVYRSRIGDVVVAYLTAAG